jgi:hypothetical protein
VKRGIRTSRVRRRVQLRRVLHALFLDPARIPARHRTARETKTVDEKEEEGVWDRLDEGVGKMICTFLGISMIPLLLCCYATNDITMFSYTLCRFESLSVKTSRYIVPSRDCRFPHPIKAAFPPPYFPCGPSRCASNTAQTPPLTASMASGSIFASSSTVPAWPAQHLPPEDAFAMPE